MENVEKRGVPSESILREKENLEMKCQLLEKELPSFMEPFFLHLVASFQPKSRLAYLREAKRFIEYLEAQYGCDCCGSSSLLDVTADQIRSYIQGTDGKENGEKALLRKRSILKTLFNQMADLALANKEVAESIGKIAIKTQGFSAIKEPWQDLDKTLEGIKSGLFLTDKEKQYWEKTKYRDYLILVLFGRLGLLVQEAYHLDISDIDWVEKRLRIYGKGGREEWIPFDLDTERAMGFFLTKERQTIRGQEDALLISLKGLRLSKRQLREITKKYTASARGKHREDGLSPQKLRGMNRITN